MEVKFLSNKIGNTNFNKLFSSSKRFPNLKGAVANNINVAVPAISILSLLMLGKTSGNIQLSDYKNLYLENFLRDNPEIAPKVFKNYLNSINIEGIKRIAPVTMMYGTKDWIDFASIHFLMGTKDFTKNTLKLPKDLTYLLSNNSLNGYLYMLLNAYPNTYRQIGSIPTDWFSKEPSNDKKNLLNSTIGTFRKRVNNRKELSENIIVEECETFAKKLANILDKKVEVTTLGIGSHSFVYKINVEEAKPSVLKIYNKNACKAMDHGVYAETPKGLFLNKMFPDKFVSFYYGKVPHSYINDGYMLCEFLEEGGELSIESVFSNDEYEIECSDVGFGYNVAQGKIFDFGGTYIYPKNSKNLKDILRLLQD